MLKNPPIRNIGILLLILLAGCDDAALKSVDQILWIGAISFAVFGAGITFIGIPLFATELRVLILNFDRPTRLSIVGGYVLGGVQFIIGTVGILITILLFTLPGNAPAINASELPLNMRNLTMLTATSLLFGFGLGGALIGSSLYGRKRLSDPQPASGE